MSIQTPGQIPQPESGAGSEAGAPGEARAEPGEPAGADPAAAPMEAFVVQPGWYTPILTGPAPAPAPTGPLARVPGDAKAFLGIGVAGIVMGIVVGALWRWISPPIQGVISQGAAYYAAPEGKTFIAQDGWFALLALCAGVLLAVAAFVRCRAAGSLGAILGLGAGGVGGGYFAAWFGTYIGPGHGSIQRTVQGVAENATFSLPMQLRSTGVIWLWPAVAAGLYFFLMLLFGPDDPPRPGQIDYADVYQAPIGPAEGPSAPDGAGLGPVPPSEGTADPD